MSFDPDAYLAAPPAFDPDAYLAQASPVSDTLSVRTEPPPEDDPAFWTKAQDILRAAGKGGLQSFTANFADEIGGVGGALVDSAFDDDGASFGDRYRKNKGRVRKEFYQPDAEASPWATGIGNVVGGVAGALALPVARVASGALTAGASMLGAGEQDLTDMPLDEAWLSGTKDAASGAALGAFADKVLPMAGPALKKGLEYGKIGVGKVGQFPKQVSEALEGFMGKSSTVQRMTPGAVRLADEFGDSAGMKSAKQLVRTADLGEGAGAFAKAAQKLGDVSVPAAEAIAQNGDVVAEAFVDSLAAKGVKVSRDAVKERLSAILEAAGVSPDDSLEQALRLIVKHDPANVAKRVMTSDKAYREIVENMDPRWGEAADRMAGLRGDFEAGKLNRGFGPASDANPEAFDLGYHDRPGYAAGAAEPEEVFASKARPGGGDVAAGGGASSMDEQMAALQAMVDGEESIMAQAKPLDNDGSELWPSKKNTVKLAAGAEDSTPSDEASASFNFGANAKAAGNETGQGGASLYKPDAPIPGDKTRVMSGKERKALGHDARPTDENFARYAAEVSSRASKAGRDRHGDAKEMFAALKRIAGEDPIDLPGGQDPFDLTDVSARRMNPDRGLTLDDGGFGDAFTSGRHAPTDAANGGMLGDLTGNTPEAIQAKTPWDDAAVNAARDKIRRVQTGRRFGQKVVAPAAGFLAGGVHGAAAAAIGGYGAKAGVNAASEVGQALERSGLEQLRPENVAKSLLANPNLLPQLAKQSGRIGRMAKFAIEAMGEGGENLKSRMWALALNPEFREAVAGVDTELGGEDEQQAAGF